MDAKRAFRKGYNMLQNKTIVVAGGDLRQAQLARLLREPGLAARLGQNARQQVQQYGLEQVFPQVWAQYEKLIEQI